MASPPYNPSPSAASPPYPAHSTVPQLSINTTTKKKRASEGNAAPPALKRRKASTMSVTSATGSAHPLRQTSFPPDESQAATPYSARSPSVDTASLVSGSQVSAGINPATKRKKRGRKTKAELAQAGVSSASGGLSGRAGTVISTASGVTGDAGGKRGGGADDQAEEEEDDSGPVIINKNEEQRALDRAKEQKMRALLTRAMSPAQYGRFEIFRVTKLQDATVRRLVNATVSQSVPANFVLGIRSVAKMFAGDIIEEARRVQGEWVAKGEQQADHPHPIFTNARGPLRPEHLVEAWRRYKQDGDGGAGIQGLWHRQQEDGVERFARGRGRALK